MLLIFFSLIKVAGSILGGENSCRLLENSFRSPDKMSQKKLKGILTYLEKRNEKAMFIGRLYFPVFFVYVAQKCFVISIKLFKMFII